MRPSPTRRGGGAAMREATSAASSRLAMGWVMGLVAAA